MRRRTAVTASVAAVCAGVLIAVGFPLLWSNDARTKPSFGAGVAGRLAQAPVTQPSASPTPPPTPSPAALPPLQLSIAGAGITAPIVPVGVDPSGAVSIPEDVKTVGWYRFSAVPGSAAGSIVLVGHVDSAQQGTGAFFRLPAVSAGDRVSLT